MGGGGYAWGMISRALAPFGTTIFTTMTKLAQQHGAVNLSQGFPDFDGPALIKRAAKEAIDREEGNQYAPMAGVPALRHAIAERFVRDTGVACDAETQVVVTAGCTEAIAATMFGLLNPGDEVVLFEPFYDSYRACVAMAGATARYVALRPPRAEQMPARQAVGEGGIVRAGFTFDERELRSVITPRTRAILVNTPHNPTGKVFTRDEMLLIAKVCVEHDLIAICDEVYERLLFDGRAHVSMASLPGMSERTLTLSSLGKTFSFTGWKIGWAVGPAALVAAVRAAHQFLTFSVATPLQHAAAVALKHEAEALGELTELLVANREKLAPVLAELGFEVYLPEGTYFIMADHTRVSRRLEAADDKELCMKLIERVKVAAIPPSVFYDRAELGRPLVRFALCKRAGTIDEGIRRLRGLAGMKGA